MRFGKYEGLGNDFIVVDVDAPDQIDAERARQLCDRHFGIGADGVLLVSPARTTGARARMTVLNADGSQPEMCGNGLRCVALHLAGLDKKANVAYLIETDAGTRHCQVERDGVLADVAIAMGAASVLPSVTRSFAGKEYEFLRVSTGNPHAILFGHALELAQIDVFGSEVSASLAGGSNVEFVTERGAGAFDVIVWERGVGRTLACGTGAAATAVAAAASDRAAFGTPLKITLPGGPLEVTVSDAKLESVLRGPARRVFEGQLQ